MMKVIARCRGNKTRLAEEALGDKFDIRALHDTVLGGGAMPLTILERRVDDWIADVNAG